ncbi:hypothetical protein ARMSODRAFT_1018270 [Armillaria solidipes]|uniref:Uncharacterized protein n=1 Tax=Armillaria solidipes TaxID=1076256 RepID=A0A2H3BH32_9AGAR|nr:hypothetical protein ARMSODRAFT_1018270 [Armillaria solidipes]
MLITINGQSGFTNLLALALLVCAAPGRNFRETDVEERRWDIHVTDPSLGIASTSSAVSWSFLPASIYYLL